jgi:drug/metabolite transporter (DMT)-like permease
MEKIINNYLTLLLLAIIWGSSFILMKRGLEVFDFMQVASLRIVIAFLSLIPFLPKAFRSVEKKPNNIILTK